MLIKPWDEIHAPRHIIEEEWKDQKEYIPTISINIDEQISSVNNFIIIPQTINVISSSLPLKGKIGTIVVDYPDVKEIKVEKEDEDEYDEDEQLYAAVKYLSLNKKYATVEIPILKYDDSNLAITVPHFTNIIVNNLVAQEVIKTYHNIIKGQWITLAPCNLNNYQSINRIQLGGSTGNTQSSLELVPDLKPPHFLTGITASFISRLKNVSDAHLLGLVLNADGQPGFEKIDADSIVDAAYVLTETVFVLKKEEIVKKISLSIRKFNSISSSGMFI